MRCSNTIIRSTVWALVMSGNRRCTGPDRPAPGECQETEAMAMITYESAVHHHSDHPHDLHRGLPTPDVLKTRQSNLGSPVERSQTITYYFSSLEKIYNLETERDTSLTCTRSGKGL